MTQITVDFSELEHLQTRIKTLEKENKQLTDKVLSLDAKQIEEDARRLAYSLCDKYINAIFVKLGFCDTPYHSINWNFNRNDDWTNKEAYTAEICAIIYNNYKEAFIRIGLREEILTDKK